MLTSRTILVLTALNAVFLGGSLIAQFGRSFADEELPILRGRGLQIVDSHGQIRASIAVMEPEDRTQGAETVLLRLITEKGRPTVKLSASEPATGLSLAGPTGTSSTYIILKAEGNESSVKLSNEAGRQQVVAP